MYQLLKEAKHYIFLFVTTLLLAYIIGLTIVSVINSRLTELTINLPSGLTDSSPQPAPEKTISQPEELKEGYTSSLRPSPNLNYTNDDLRGFIAQKEYRDCTEETDQIQRERNIQMNNVCMFKHDHKKYMCTYGKTNYLHPEELDPVNRRIFKYNYLPNMTLQDYINWLQLYKKDADKLCYEHYKNLKKLQGGTPLRYQPGICPPNLTACGVACGGPTDVGKYYKDMMAYIDLDPEKPGVKGFNYLNY